MASTTSSKSSRTEATAAAKPRQLPQWVDVGRVIRPHGVRGEVSIAVESDTADRFVVGSTVWWDGRSLEVATQRRHQGVLLVGFSGFSDRDEANALRGARLTVPREEVPPAPQGEFYFFELEGCLVVDELLGDLGPVLNVHEDGGGLLLEVSILPSSAVSAHLEMEPEQGKERSESAAARTTVLIPFVRRHLVEVDVASGVIRTRLPEGLVELCASTS